MTVSDDLRRWLVTDVRIPAGMVRTIPNGVDATRFAPREGASARTALGLVVRRPVHEFETEGGLKVAWRRGLSPRQREVRPVIESVWSSSI